MRKPFICLVLLTAFLCWGMTPALGAPPPVTGTWTGTAYIAYDSGYDSTPMTLAITHQRGTRFRGTVTFPEPYGDGTPWPLNGIIFNNRELHFTAGKAVTASCLLDNITAPTRIRGYFHHLEESYSVPVVPAHTGAFVLDKTP